MTENMEIAMAAINKWIFHGYNYEMVSCKVATPRGTVMMDIPRFIAEVKWNCGVYHMAEKWRTITERFGQDGWLNRLYCELTRGNRIALMEWILTNYKSEPILHV